MPNFQHMVCNTNKAAEAHDTMVEACGLPWLEQSQHKKEYELSTEWCRALDQTVCDRVAESLWSRGVSL